MKTRSNWRSVRYFLKLVLILNCISAYAQETNQRSAVRLILDNDFLNYRGSGSDR